eukprot:13841391-Alexandrium_andersonii.AAC.1
MQQHSTAPDLSSGHDWARARGPRNKSCAAQSIEHGARRAGLGPGSGPTSPSWARPRTHSPSEE